MKKKILFGFGIMAISVMILFNVNLVSNKTLGTVDLTSLIKIAKADGEGAEITCSSGETGQCFVLAWELCRHDSNSLFTYDCYWTGVQANYCSGFVCWLCNYYCI